MACGKYFICAVLVAFVGLAAAMTDEEAKAALMSFAADCIKEIPLTDEEITGMKEHKPMETENTKCVAACMFRKMGVMDDQGVMSKEGAKALAEKMFKDDSEKIENMMNFMETCKHVNEAAVSDGAKGCERASLAYDCALEHASKFGLVLTK